jgi:hypothetical protein
MKYFIKSRSFLFLGCSFLMLLTHLSKLNAQGNLLLSPQRVLFEGAKRYEEITLANTGKDSATYAMSFVQMRMLENGKIEMISEPDSLHQFADKNIRYYPRMVTLAPGESQTVKVQLVNSSELPDGEYRSHMHFRAVKNRHLNGDENITKQDSSSSVNINVVYGFSIPMIIRKGQSTTTATLANLELSQVKDSVKLLSFAIQRSGNMSVFGDLEVEHISPEGQHTQVARLKGVAVYTPNSFRNVRLMLNSKLAVNYQSGSLQVVFKDRSSNGKVLASTQIPLL